MTVAGLRRAHPSTTLDKSFYLIDVTYHILFTLLRQRFYLLFQINLLPIQSGI